MEITRPNGTVRLQSIFFSLSIKPVQKAAGKEGGEKINWWEIYSFFSFSFSSIFKYEISKVLLLRKVNGIYIFQFVIFSRVFAVARFFALIFILGLKFFAVAAVVV